MSINSSTTRVAARYLLLRLAAFTNGLGERFLNGAVRIKGGRRLGFRQREFLHRDFRLELESAVEEAERHANDFELRYELSRPRAQDKEGRVIAWSDRILFPPVEIEGLPGRDDSGRDDDEEDGGLDVPVERI